MTWLEKIRKKSDKEKVRLIWTITGVAFVLLVAAWILVGNYNYGVHKDLTIFQTLDKGIKDFKSTTSN